MEEAAGWRKLLPGRRRFKNVQAEVNFVSISQTADLSAAPFSSKTLKLELNNVQVKAWPRGLPAGGVGGGCLAPGDSKSLATTSRETRKNKGKTSVLTLKTKAFSRTDRKVGILWPKSQNSSCLRPT